MTGVSFIVAALIWLASMPPVRAKGDASACREFSARALLDCLAAQNERSASALDTLYRQRLADLPAAKRNDLSRSESDWNARVGPQCDAEAGEMGLQPQWQDIAALQCLLKRTNARFLELKSSAF